MNPNIKKEDFISLIEKHQGIIHKVSKMYCNRDECQKDLFQDILVQLWQSYSSFNGKSKFSTWMYRVALNTAIAQYKRDRKNNEDTTQTIPINIVDDDSYNEKENQRNLVHKAIAKLNKAEKAIIILYMDDYSYEEIADIAGITVSNVGVKINRIKHKLQSILKELEYGV